MAKKKRVVRSCCSSSTPSKPEPESKSDWEGLPGHLLDLILDKLAINLCDYYRLGVVCKAWKSCMLDHYTRNRITLTAHHLPFLLLGSRSPPEDAKSMCLYNFSTGKICKFKLDMIKPFSKFDYKNFRGSSYGWLFFMKNFVPTLLNPLSGAFFSLPALYVSKPIDSFDTFILSRDPSLGSFEVLASSYFVNLLAHFRSGDESWTYLENWKSDYFNFESFIFTKHHILAVSAPDDRSDKDENNLSLHIISRDFDPLSKGSIKEIPRASELDGDRISVSSYFVETTSGDLLMVLRYYEWDDEFIVGTFKAYKIYKLIGLGLEEQVELVQIEDLGSDCLFLGDSNHSISVLASNYPKFMPNTIYCSDNNDKGNIIEVFNLKDGIMASCCLPKMYSLIHEAAANLIVPSIKL